MVDFHVVNYVLLHYPNRPTKKSASLYRGPLIIVAIKRPDIITVEDLISNKVIQVHTSRILLFRHPNNIGFIHTRDIEEITALSAADLDDFYVEKLLIMWK